MITILIDHDIEGQAMLLRRMLRADGWLTLVDLRLLLFDQVGLLDDTSDQQVWRFAQAHSMILLTGNRRMMEEDSLEQTIRQENTLTSLPVLTIGNIRRINEKFYMALR